MASNEITIDKPTLVICIVFVVIWFQNIIHNYQDTINDLANTISQIEDLAIERNGNYEDVLDEIVHVINTGKQMATEKNEERLEDEIYDRAY